MLTLKYGLDWSFFHLQCLGLQFSDELRVILGKFRTISQRLIRINVSAELPLRCQEKDLGSPIALTFTGHFQVRGLSGGRFQVQA